MTATLERPTYQVDVPEGTSNHVEVRRFIVEDNIRERLSMMKSGRGVPPGEYTGLYRNGRMWMSDTPDEIRDQYEVFRQMRARGGRVVINGLGLGTTVRYALSLPNVEHVDVVEFDADVIALVADHYAGERCTIHHADAYEMKWSRGTRWTVAWHDIWENICGDNQEGITRLKRAYGRRVDWQAAWVEAEVRRANASAARWRY